MIPAEPTVVWLACNVGLALLPLSFNALLLALFNVKNKWAAVMREGELFIFSSTLSATSIGISVYDGLKTGLLNVIAFWILVIVLALASGLFAISSLSKLKGESIPNEKLYIGASVSCAVLTVVFSYILALGNGF